MTRNAIYYYSNGYYWKHFIFWLQQFFFFLFHFFYPFLRCGYFFRVSLFAVLIFLVYSSVRLSLAIFLSNSLSLPLAPSAGCAQIRDRESNLLTLKLIEFWRMNLIKTVDIRLCAERIYCFNSWHCSAFQHFLLFEDWIFILNTMWLVNGHFWMRCSVFV